MTRIFENQVFKDFYDRNSGRVYQDAEFRGCKFIHCTILVGRRRIRRPVVRNVKLLNCAEHNCYFEGAFVEDVLVDGLKTSGLLRVYGSAFKHVTLRGRVDRLMINSILSPIDKTKPEHQQAVAQENAAYYATVDWALDISEADFVECDIRGVPARLIRRDPATQAVVTLEKALEGNWKQLDLSGTWWPTVLEFLPETGSDGVLVVPKRDPKFRQLLDGLKLLRYAGVAEVD